MYISPIFKHHPFQVGVAHGLGTYEVAASTIGEALMMFMVMESCLLRQTMTGDLSLEYRDVTFTIPQKAWNKVIDYAQQHSWDLYDFIDDEAFWMRINNEHAAGSYINVYSSEGYRQVRLDETWMAAWLILCGSYNWDIHTLLNACKDLTFQDLDTIVDYAQHPSLQVLLPVDSLKPLLNAMQQDASLLEEYPLYS